MVTHDLPRVPRVPQVPQVPRVRRVPRFAWTPFLGLVLPQLNMAKRRR
jgi:hypothetical protein